MSWLTTHILDTSLGKPAANVVVVCELEQDAAFKEVARGTTDADGRLRSLFADCLSIKPGIYRLSFETGEYFATLQQKTFFPRVQIVFEVLPGEQHYHVPILISPFGYSTYRGS